MPVQRVRLNPCDYLFWGQHVMNARRGEGGNIAFMLMDLEGPLDPAWLRESLERVMRAHPVVLARFQSTLFLGRPEWRIPADVDRAVRDAMDWAFIHEDLRGTSDWHRRLEDVSRIGNIPGWPIKRGPLVRIELYSLPEDRSRLILRWPHMLMDAEGAQWFLSELARCGVQGGGGSSGVPVGLARDENTVHPIAHAGSIERWKLFAKGAGYQRAYGRHRYTLLPPEQKGRPIDHRVIHRNWSVAQTRDVQALARQSTPTGPALYARNLAACTVRAIHQLYQCRSIDTDAYLITLPMRVGAADPSDALFASRPMIGNYLVSPFLRIPREAAADRRRIGEAILAQLADYHARRADLLQWSMMWAASLIHAWAYELIFRLPFGSGQFATGFSIYGEINPPIRRMGTARVLNLWGGGPNTNPPALNPVFSKFEDRLNFSLTYTRPVVSDETAVRFVELIEAEMFGAS